MKASTVSLTVLVIAALAFAVGQNAVTKLKQAEKLDCSKSSAIHSAIYYPEYKTLDVRFKSKPSKKYTYWEISRKVWDGWKAAPSKGKYYNNVIRRKK